MNSSSLLARAFTVVELLIAIVVIGILATISIVAYSGIQDSAIESTLKSDLRSASSQLEMERALEGSYPSSDEGLSRSSGVNFTYTLTGGSYCLTAWPSRAGVAAYRIDSDSSVQEGACTGHVSPAGPGPVATLTNLHYNPSLEVVHGPFSGANTTSVTRTSVRSHVGSWSLRADIPAGFNSRQVGAIMMNRDVGDFFEPNTTYTASAYVYVPSGTVDVEMVIIGAGRASVVDPPGRTASAKGSWTRIHNTFTTGSSGRVQIFIVNSSSTSSGPGQFWVDAVMITEGATLHDYRDGSFEGWTWTGADENSASTGPMP